ncbi:TioE family transcriptional regulator [Streptomyces sp. NPDC127112]|uniref:TioE family transcriptional regulator n=1 Tax=Streptomyces sp. NPDC127112 TaxID=3345364 RepID=UPI00362DC636
MEENLQTGRKLRPVDLARAHGLSTQAVRNYEEAGVLPPAARGENGYRAYTPGHALALAAFLALVPGHGHATATAVMRAVNRGACDEAFRLIDLSHAQLAEDRRTLEAVQRALRDLAPAPGTTTTTATATATATDPLGATGTAADPDGARESEGATGGGPGGRFIGPLARELGVRPATLRKWEAAGLVRPRRDPLTGYRVYDAAAVRDARLAHQLRRGGYLLEQIAPLAEQVRAAGGLEPLEAALGAWRARLSARGRALLAGAAELEAYLRAAVK